MNRIGHPDWVKLSVELNCALNQNTKFPFTTKSPIFRVTLNEQKEVNDMEKQISHQSSLLNKNIPSSPQ